MYNSRRLAKALRRIRKAGYVPTEKVAERVYKVVGTGQLEGKTGIVIFADYDDLPEVEDLSHFLDYAVRFFDEEHDSVCYAVDYYFGAVPVAVKERLATLTDDVPVSLASFLPTGL